ncbi:MAG: SDR family oxidoreductase [Candidatus Omnitrophica bacterium]|nr:SDR family oxidoreductase [Candidatus Omnitrophota bacterium]
MALSNAFLLNGKIAVVTGGSGLIGQAIVRVLAQGGARVVIADIDEKKTESVLKELKGEGLAVSFQLIDISDPMSINAAIKQICSQEGKIDIWVNNAYPRSKDWGNKFEDIQPDSLKWNMEKHLNGYFFCCQAIAEVFKKQKAGVIVNLGSQYGVLAPNFSVYEGTEMTMPAAYSMIKGGIVNLTRYLATYLADYNVRANVVCPAGVFDHQPEQFIERYKKCIPMKRMARADEVANAVYFLSSELSSYMTGQVLMVDGGLSCW